MTFVRFDASRSAGSPPPGFRKWNWCFGNTEPASTAEAADAESSPWRGTTGDAVGHLKQMSCEP